MSDEFFFRLNSLFVIRVIYHCLEKRIIIIYVFRMTGKELSKLIVLILYI